jgi:hypothetical protein
MPRAFRQTEIAGVSRVQLDRILQVRGNHKVGVERARIDLRPQLLLNLMLRIGTLDGAEHCELWLAVRKCCVESLCDRRCQAARVVDNREAERLVGLMVHQKHDHHEEADTNQRQ